MDASLTTSWRPDPPTEPGTYWFYGRRYPGDTCRVRVIEVHRTSAGFGLMSQGMCCRGELMQGVWTPAVHPALPILQES